MAAALLAVYVTNVLIGKAAAIAGVKIEWRLGDVGEFLVVLAMAVAFVTGLIINEGAPRAPQEE